METAKVDIRKLQLLNDRIAQCFYALNQVRLSVHGLSQGNPYGAAGIGATNPAGINPMTGFTQGLQHTSPFGSPFGAGIGASPFGIGAQQPGVVPGFGVSPVGPPYAGFGNPLAGLSHTSGETFDAYSRPTWADPILAARVAQTFPYAYSFYALPQVVSLI